MKLIYIANARIPTEKAHGIQIVKMCEAFALQSVEIEVELVIPKRFNKIKNNPFDYYDVKRVFKVTKLPCLDLIPFDLGNFSFWIQTITFLISTKIYLFFKKYDVLYTREQFVGLFFKDYILEVHTLPEKIKPIYKKIWRKAKSLIVLTGFIKDRLVKEGINKEKILVAPDGVDLEKFDISISKKDSRDKLNLPQNKKLVGYVGMLKTMAMEKGVDIAIKSLKFLPNDYFLMLVGGDKEDIEYYENLAKSENLENRVLFIGRVAYSEVPFYLKSSDVLIAPFPENEHYKYYMSPLKLFEYMASGVPIVASDLPSIREVLNENSAVLVEPNNPKKLAEGIDKSLQNKALADQISKNALQDIKDHTWQKRAEMVLEFIDKF